MPAADAQAHRMYRWDLVRGVGHGVMEACWSSIALLVAIRVFDAPEMLKAFLPAAIPLGLLMTAFTLPMLRKARGSVGAVCACIYGGGAALLALAGLAETLAQYIILTGLAFAALAQVVPMMTHLYAVNYKADQRGARFSMTFLVAAISGAAAAQLAGKALDISHALRTPVFGCAAAAAALAALACAKMPGGSIRTIRSGNALQNLALPFKDRLFGAILGAWFLLGTGNLMTMPLRVERMADPAFGVNASNTEIAFVIGVIPLAVRILSSRMWGCVFDRWNFLTLRITLNLLFALSIPLFFFTSSVPMMAFAMTLLGLGMSGGRIMWNLWVTKIAPSGQVSAYMSVHGALTGLRGTAAPFVGYWILREVSLDAAAWLGLSMLALSTALFVLLRALVRQRSG